MSKIELPLIFSLLYVNAGSDLDVALFVNPHIAMEEIFGENKDSFALELQVSIILGMLFRVLPLEYVAVGGDTSRGSTCVQSTVCTTSLHLYINFRNSSSVGEFKR